MADQFVFLKSNLQMKIFLTDQKKNFPVLLKELIALPLSETKSVKLIAQTSSIEIPAATGEAVNDILFDYRIFPPTIMTHLSQWSLEGRKMEIGDTILQQVYVPPFPGVSQKIIFGVRIDKITNEPNKIGFSYSTLEGHVEKGTSGFYFESVGERKFFRIETFSAPGNLLSKLTGPFFARPYRAFCTQKALEHVKKQVSQ